jgi:hypothetical protein
VRELVLAVSEGSSGTAPEAPALIGAVPAPGPGSQSQPLPVRRIELRGAAGERAATSSAPAEAKAPAAAVEPDQLTPHPTTAPAAARDQRVWGWLRFGAATAAAGVGSFFLVRALLGPSVVEPATEPVASAAAAPEPVAAPIVISVEDLDLPPDVPLSAGKALLEVDTGGAQAIYVDGQFMGHGPVRRVPLDAGPHEVRTKHGDRERTDRVILKPGRRLRLPLAAAWPSGKPAP